jgi:hypothetical protein
MLSSSYRLALGVALCALAWTAPRARAAQIQSDRTCYLDGRPAVVTGSGFMPRAPYTVTLDGRPVPEATGAADGMGAIMGTFTLHLSSLGADVAYHTYTLGVQQLATSASTQFTLTKFYADFSPERGDPDRLRVRFHVVGFGLDPAAPNPPVYLHYIRPNGRLRKTVYLGPARGPCGAIRRTRRRRLFPFPTTRGTWKLQFDTRRSFAAGKADSPFLYYTIAVRIHRRR